jgi:citrate lyase subunit beta/citryl-CoA lyase
MAVFSGKELALACQELPRVTGLGYGYGDYLRAIGAPSTSKHAREFLNNITAGLAAIGGLDPIASAYKDVEDRAGLRESAENARALGFVGQAALAPSQVPVLNATFDGRKNSDHTSLDG